MTHRRSTPPLWFAVLFAVAYALVCRALAARWGLLTPTDPHAPAVRVAFWQLIALAIGWAWNALQAAGQVTLEVLAFAVKMLQSGAATMVNGIKDVADTLRKGFMDAWGFLKATYEDVLKPAWNKFWKWFDKTRQWFHDTFEPILKVLRHVRDYLLCLYATYVRPWLDIIDVTRRMLGALAALGLPWAKALDDALGNLEEKITGPIQYIFGKLNYLIEMVNLAMTADGLFQRVTLIRSLARDYKYAWNALLGPLQGHSTPPSDGTTAQPSDATQLAQSVTDLRAYLQDGGGALATTVDEAASEFHILLHA